MKPDSFAHILKNERGVALLITLSIIAILLAVSLELNRRVTIGIMTSDIGRTEYELMEIARSGVNVAKAVLLKDAQENQIDSIQEDWANPELLNQIIQSMGFDEGELTLKIMDETGKIQVNALIDAYPGQQVNPDQKQIWETLLSFLISTDKSEDTRDPRQILNCIIDWLDDNDGETITGISGAESAYYESLAVPYSCANKDMVDLSELFFVKGISKNLLSVSDSLDPQLIEKELQFEDLFTVFGMKKEQTGSAKPYGFSGKININTAPMQVLAALLPFGLQDLAESIHSFRIQRADDQGDYTNDLSVKGWYAGITGLSQKEKEKISKLITYSSTLFSIESHARLHNRALVLKTIVQRQRDKTGKWGCKTLRQEIH